MYILKFKTKHTVNYGTEENPVIETQIRNAEYRCKNEELDIYMALAENAAYNGEYTVEDVPMTAEEVRTELDRLLAETDWTQVLDAPISDECREAFRVYRQDLWDVPAQEGFPANIEWPVMPEVSKAESEPVDTVMDALLGE